MRAIWMTRKYGMGLLAVGATAILAAGCGDDDFENEPRPAVPVELTGVIQEDKVTVSPSGTGRVKLGAGPFLITISNQTDEAHTIVLEGEEIRTQTEAINPLDTATVQKTLTPGTYEVRAGSEKARRKEIAPAILEIGDARPSSNDELLLP
jgi:hypothetical protein